MAPDGGGGGDTGGGDGPSGGRGGGRGSDGDPDKGGAGGQGLGGNTAPETGPTLTQSQMDVLTQEAPTVEVGLPPGFGRPDVPQDPRGPDLSGTSSVEGYPSVDVNNPDSLQGSYPNMQDYGFRPGLGLDIFGGVMKGLGFATPLGVGMSTTRAARAAFGESDAERRGEHDTAPESGPGDSGGVLMGEANGPPEDLPPPVFQRPSPMNAPGFLGFNPNMTDLQRRSQIATYGANSDDARYRDSETAAYYRNLLQRNLINDDGSYNDISAVLPVEQRYMQNAFGLPQSSTTLDLLRAMARV